MGRPPLSPCRTMTLKKCLNARFALFEINVVRDFTGLVTFAILTDLTVGLDHLATPTSNNYEESPSQQDCSTGNAATTPPLPPLPPPGCSSSSRTWCDLKSQEVRVVFGAGEFTSSLNLECDHRCLCV